MRGYRIETPDGIAAHSGGDWPSVVRGLGRIYSKKGSAIRVCNKLKTRDSYYLDGEWYPTSNLRVAEYTLTPTEEE